MRNKLPPNMRSDIWNEFIDCIEDELALAKQSISKKKDLYSVDRMEYDRIIELSSMLGVPFDVSIDDSLEFIKKELASAPFRIKWKATSTLYSSFFKSIRRSGEIFIYYSNGSDLIKDSIDLLVDMVGHNPLLPYVHKSKNNFTGFLTESRSLDEGFSLDDETEVWSLDQSSSKRSTNHIGLEIVLNQVFYGEEAGLAPTTNLAPALNLAPQTIVKYLVDPKYFSYIMTNIQQSKKLTEVAHVGCQLTAIADASHYYDSLGEETTMPTIFLNAVTTDHFDSLIKDGMHYMEFGIGIKTNLPSQVFGVGVQPDELFEKIARVNIIEEEKFENAEYFGACATYMGNMVNDRSIGLGDGSTTSFSSTLPFAPIKPGNVKFSYKLFSEEYVVEDDGFGNFVSEFGGGTVNYETGDVTLSTDIYYEKELSMGVGNGTAKNFSFTSPELPIGASSVFVHYIQNGTAYVATDDGAGTITGVNCTGTIVYATGVINVVFTEAIAVGASVDLKYKHRKIMPPDNGTHVLTEYYFVEDRVDITEACLRDSAGNLVAYATFPRVRFNNFFNHLSMNFILKKTVF